MKFNKEEFKKYAKEEFGCDVSFEKSSNPDTFESLFGESFINQSDKITLEPDENLLSKKTI